MSAGKIADVISDIRLDPNEIGKQMGYQDSLIQERFMKVCVAFLRELSIQKSQGGFVNGNIDTSVKAWEIMETLLTQDIKL